MDTESNGPEVQYEGTIHVMPYTHADIGWVHTRAWHLDRYTRLMDEVLDLYEKNPDYHYYIDTWIELIKPYIEFRPDAVEAIRQRVKEGRLAVCGGQYGNVRSTTIGNETQVRNMQLGMRHWKELAPDVEFKVHSNIDVTLGHTQMPQMLSLAGIAAYFVMRPLAALDAQGIPRAFFWQGLSGDKVIMYRDTGVGLFQEHERMGPEWDTDWPAQLRHIWNAYLAQPAKDGTSNIGLTVGVDDSRPERFSYNDVCADYASLIRVWNERETSRMRYGTPDTLITALQAESDKLKVIDEILDPTDVSYNIAVHGRRGIWWLREQADRLIVDAEMISALAKISGGTPYPEDAITGMWEQLLDWTPHAVQWLFREDWQEGEAVLIADARAARKQIEQSGASLTGGRLPVDSEGLAVINPLPGRAHEIMPVWVINSDLTRGLAGLKDAHGNDVPFQVIDFPVPGAELNALVEVDAPSCGYSSLKMEWEPAPSGIPYQQSIEHWAKRYGIPERKEIEFGPFEMASDAVKITMNEGCIVAVEDLATGVVREAPEGTSFLEPVYYAIERTGWSSDSIPAEPDGFRITSVRWDEAGPLRWRVTRTGRAGDYWVRQHLDLYKGERAVRSEVRFLDAGDESDSFIAMSIPITDDAHISVDIPFGIEPRHVKEIEYGISERAIPGFFWGRTWADARDKSGRVALVAADGDKFFRAYGAPRRLVHFMAQKTRIFDTSWEAYIDTSDAGGRQVFSHMMVLAGKDEPQTDLVRLAERLRHPLRTQYVPNGQLGVEKEFVKVAPETLTVSALAYEGDDLILRAVQMSPHSAEAKIELPFTPSHVELIDFRGNPLPLPISCAGSSITFPVTPWQIVTLRLRQ